ncbi:hypothetical protein LAZ67_X000864 [Cordylochernes scorpioides]|uniref:Retrotransposon gag domain-containing protein n=1 Tax=Cordylochernes scorpioides TaxID=51811 RepID=A0ABY6LSE4_9ARAC|nr:hypothetical protein LAZ67_X000864 [Cordylochernes scorpioides]
MAKKYIFSGVLAFIQDQDIMKALEPFGQLEKFTGNSSSKFDSFVKNLESVYNMHLLSDTNRVILLNNHLRGAAKDFTQLPQNDYPDYEELKRRLSKKFRVHVPAAESRKNFFGVRQMLGESVTDFADRLVSLAHQIESEDLMIGRGERKRVFVAGLHPAIRSCVFDHHQEDWDTLMYRAQGVEDNERELSLTKEEWHQKELERLTKKMTEMYEEIRELRRAQDTTKKQENNREYRQHYIRGTYNRDQRDQNAGNSTTHNHRGNPQHDNGPRSNSHRSGKEENGRGYPSDHPASSQLLLIASGSSDLSLAHRYWSCSAVYPLIREAISITERPPDAVGPEDHAIAISFVDREMCGVAGERWRFSNKICSGGRGIMYYIHCI